MSDHEKQLGNQVIKIVRVPLPQTRDTSRDINIIVSLCETCLRASFLPEVSGYESGNRQTRNPSDSLLSCSIPSSPYLHASPGEFEFRW